MEIRNTKKRADSRREAERCFLLAIETARRQQAKFLMLRSLLSLHKLWRDTDKQGKAHALLQKTYQSFTEGFDTPDLKKANQILHGLV
jgi:predicted ATPase